MSIAFKCDRCKKCFNPYEVKDPAFFTTIKGFYCQDGKQFANNEYGYAEHDEAHLCPECSEKFAMFASNIEDKETIEYAKEAAEALIRETEQFIAETILDYLPDHCAGDCTDPVVEQSPKCKKCKAGFASVNARTGKESKG